MRRWLQVTLILGLLCFGVSGCGEPGYESYGYPGYGYAPYSYGWWGRVVSERQRPNAFRPIAFCIEAERNNGVSLTYLHFNPKNTHHARGMLNFPRRATSEAMSAIVTLASSFSSPFLARINVGCIASRMLPPTAQFSQGGTRCSENNSVSSTAS